MNKLRNSVINAFLEFKRCKLFIFNKHSFLLYLLYVVRMQSIPNLLQTSLFDFLAFATLKPDFTTIQLNSINRFTGALKELMNIPNQFFRSKDCLAVCCYRRGNEPSFLYSFTLRRMGNFH